MFIFHPDFKNVVPRDNFHKEISDFAESVPHGENLCNFHALFRRKFIADRSDDLILSISADDYYKVYINGRFVCQGPAPGYFFHYYYNEIDVTPYITDGENVIAVHCYYQGLINRVWPSGDGRAMFWCELSRGGKTVLASDGSWKCARHTGFSSDKIYGNNTAFSENYDANCPEDGFEAPNFDDSSWGNAAVMGNAEYNLVKQPTKTLDVYTMPPVSLTEKVDSDGGSKRYTVDFGQETVGAMRASFIGKKGDTVTLRYAEELNSDGTPRYKLHCGPVYEETLTLCGNAARDHINSFDYKGFRYAEIIAPRDVTLMRGSVLAEVRHYPFELKTEFSYLDARCKPIIDLCVNTVKFATQDGYIDCPTREKGEYLGDAIIHGRAHAALIDDTALLKKSLLDACRSARICPGLMCISPCSFMQEIADYSLQLVGNALFAYKIDKDLEYLREILPYAEGMKRHFEGFENSDGLLEDVIDKWNLVDWPLGARDGYDMPTGRLLPRGFGPHNVINAFWYGFLSELDELKNILGLPTDGKTKSVEAAFIKAFFDEGDNLFSDRPHGEHKAIHSNILPFYFGLGMENEAAKRAVIDMLRRKRLTSMGVYTAYFALEGLRQNDEIALMEELICDDGAWLNMIKEGATTTFEAWGKAQKWNTSLCHPWAVAPAIVLAK